MEIDCMLHNIFALEPDKLSKETFAGCRAGKDPYGSGWRTINK